jgi:hypothetical protein
MFNLFSWHRRLFCAEWLFIILISAVAGGKRGMQSVAQTAKDIVESKFS